MWDRLQGGVWINLATSLSFSLFWFLRATTTFHCVDFTSSNASERLSAPCHSIAWKLGDDSRLLLFFSWIVFPTPEKQTPILICRRSNGFCNMLLPHAIKTEGKMCTWGSHANYFLHLPPSIRVSSLCLQQRTANWWGEGKKSLTSSLLITFAKSISVPPHFAR